MGGHVIFNQSMFLLFHCYMKGFKAFNEAAEDFLSVPETVKYLIDNDTKRLLLWHNPVLIGIFLNNNYENYFKAHLIKLVRRLFNYSLF